MSTLSLETVIHRLELPGSRIQNEMVFFDPRAGKYFATGPVGADIWDFLDTPKAVSSICDHLMTRYEIDRTTCERDVSGFLTEMLDAGIIAAEVSPS